MKANNNWPDVNNYKPLTLSMARAVIPCMTVGHTTARVEEYVDDDTNMYVPSCSETPLLSMIPHLYASV
jgi:hypothetical protein